MIDAKAIPIRFNGDIDQNIIKEHSIANYTLYNKTIRYFNLYLRKRVQTLKDKSKNKIHGRRGTGSDSKKANSVSTTPSANHMDTGIWINNSKWVKK